MRSQDFQAEHPNTVLPDASAIERRLRLTDSRDPISARLGTVEYLNRTKKLEHEREARKERAAAELVRKNAQSRHEFELKKAQNQQEFDDQIQKINEEYTASRSEVGRQYVASLNSQVPRPSEVAGTSPLLTAPTPQMSSGSVDDEGMFQQPGIGTSLANYGLQFQEGCAEVQEATNFYHNYNFEHSCGWSL